MLAAIMRTGVIKVAELGGRIKAELERVRFNRSHGLVLGTAFQADRDIVRGVHGGTAKAELDAQFDAVIVQAIRVLLGKPDDLLTGPSTAGA